MTFYRFSNVPLQFLLLRPLLHTVSFHFFLRGSYPLPDQLPGEHTGPPSHMRQYLYIIWPFNAAFTHTLSHGR